MIVLCWPIHQTAFGFSLLNAVGNVGKNLVAHPLLCTGESVQSLVRASTLLARSFLKPEEFLVLASAYPDRQRESIVLSDSRPRDEQCYRIRFSNIRS